MQWSIIPYQEPPGNYNRLIDYGKEYGYYTIPRTTGELQLGLFIQPLIFYYTIPRTTGELQPVSMAISIAVHYTIPRTTGELQRSVVLHVCRRRIIPYQEPPGNYNERLLFDHFQAIIPYQEPPGNYNTFTAFFYSNVIIPYQEPPGNYNRKQHKKHSG